MSQIVLFQRQLSWPTDWSKVFDREAPFVVEIGFGGGHFLVDLAQKRPYQNILVVEISIPSIQRGERKIRNLGLTHCKILQTDAQFLLQMLCKPESIQEIYINFPDPWRKAAHHNRRLINLHFLELLATRMVNNGRLDIATDHADYQDVITETLENTPYFYSRAETIFNLEDPERLRTKYELKAIQEGRICKYYKWARNELAPATPFLPPQEVEMPHIVLQTPLTLDDIQSAYQPLKADSQNIYVKLTEMFKSNDGQKLFIEAYVNEKPLAQRVGILIREREDNEIIILLHEVGFPRSTTGLHLAIAKIANWILNLNESGEIKKSNLQFSISELDKVEVS
ncbi:MAG: tRNA (guanosine(46)-N7)-methyltransferase TrmB [Chloroflexota bacterium]